MVIKDVPGQSAADRKKELERMAQKRVKIGTIVYHNVPGKPISDKKK